MVTYLQFVCLPRVQWMSDREDLRSDPDSWSLVLLVEHSTREIEEMSSSIEAESEDALPAEARRSDAACIGCIPRLFE